MPHDLYAEIDQTAVDKLLSSSSYPLTLFEKSQSFPGCDNLALQREGSVYKLQDAETDELFKRAAGAVAEGKPDDDRHFLEQIYAFGCSILDQCKNSMSSTESSDYHGPPKQDLERILNGGLPSLSPNLRKILGDWGLYAWCSHLEVDLRQEPVLHLDSPRVDLKNIRVAGSATGEVWAKYPWYSCHCHPFPHCDCHWVTKCDRIASISVTIDVAADAHIDFLAQGAKVFGKGAFDRLRLDYPILRDIPLEGIANSALANKNILIYDAAKLVETVPVLGSKFTVGAIELPGMHDGLGIGVVLSQIHLEHPSEPPEFMARRTVPA